MRGALIPASSGSFSIIILSSFPGSAWEHMSFRVRGDICFLNLSPSGRTFSLRFFNAESQRTNSLWNQTDILRVVARGKAPKQSPEPISMRNPGDCFASLATSMTFSVFTMDHLLSAPLRLCVKTLQRNKLDFLLNQDIPSERFLASLEMT